VDWWLWCHFVPYLLGYTHTNNYSNIERSDKVIAKIKWCSFFLPHGVNGLWLRIVDRYASTGKVSVTVTFVPVTLKCHQFHVDVVMSYCDKFHEDMPRHSGDRWETTSLSAYLTKHLWSRCDLDLWPFDHSTLKYNHFIFVPNNTWVVNFVKFLFRFVRYRVHRLLFYDHARTHARKARKQIACSC